MFSPNMNDATTTTLFEAVIVPHRSLSKRGIWQLIGVIALMCGLTGLRFWTMGAWPIAAFGVIEVGLAAYLITLNARRARASELLVLTAHEMRVVRTDMDGVREERSLPAGWLQAMLEERPGRVPGLYLVAYGVREEVATVLGEAAKRDLARALSGALHRMRNPVFENPHLSA
jgi:uncharacterized membrane protein